MAINRAPFNALVDDDGSNTIGSPWNKAAIAGVLLDPIDAALNPILIFKSNGSTVSTAAENVTYATVPQLGHNDMVIGFLAVANYSIGPGPTIVDLALVPGGGAFVDSIVLTGATGAGDLQPGGIGVWRIELRPAAPATAGNTVVTGYGVPTVGVGQSRGATFARVSVGQFINQAGNLIALRHYGVTGGGTLYWAWTVYQVKG